MGAKQASLIATFQSAGLGQPARIVESCKNMAAYLHSPHPGILLASGVEAKDEALGTDSSRIYQFAKSL